MANSVLERLKQASEELEHAKGLERQRQRLPTPTEKQQQERERLMQVKSEIAHLRREVVQTYSLGVDSEHIHELQPDEILEWLRKRDERDMLIHGLREYEAAVDEQLLAIGRWLASTLPDTFKEEMRNAKISALGKRIQALLAQLENPTGSAASPLGKAMLEQQLVEAQREYDRLMEVEQAKKGSE